MLDNEWTRHSHVARWRHPAVRVAQSSTHPIASHQIVAEKASGRSPQALISADMASSSRWFTHPLANAVRVALAMLDAISKLNEQSDSLLLKGGGPGWGSRPKLTARVGIDSGAVVVGAGAGKEADVFGEAPNIAARVQAAAEPGTVLITDAVHQLVSGLFVVESRGAATLKGVERPLQLYQVVQPSGVRGRLEATAAVRGLTPFVGREDELRSLMTRWERSREGEGQVALIVGEAGIGKSRLLQHFHELIPDTPH